MIAGGGQLIVLLGAPGAGKGTVAARIESQRGWSHLSSGELLRQAVQLKTPAGSAAERYMQRGELVPDDVIGRIVGEALENTKDRGVVLDGYPRTPEQAAMLSDQLKATGFRMLAALMLEVDDATLAARLSGRRVCQACGAVYHVETLPPRIPDVCDRCGAALSIRSDDVPETIHRRLEVYREKTEPVVTWYERIDLLLRVNGNGEASEVIDRVMEQLDQVSSASAEVS